MNNLIGLCDVARVSPYVVESKLRNSSVFNGELAIFYRTCCPKFRNFTELVREMDSLGTGIDSAVIIAFMEHNEIIEKHINEVLLQLGVHNTEFIRAIISLKDDDEDCWRSLVDLCYLDSDWSVISFGHMMESKFNKTFSLYEVAAPIVPNDRPRQELTSYHVRVLWDIENISVSNRCGGLKTVAKVRKFLSSIGKFGPNIDTRISAFFSPEKRHISSKTLNELDKASVELVWVGTKREDADRKLEHRIMQEIEVLKDVARTTFILISSDQDYRNILDLLVQRGYETIVIHAATGDSWTSTLELCSTSTYHWKDIINDSEELSEDDSTPSPPEGVSIGWMDAVCVRWKDVYGFLSVPIAALYEMQTLHKIEALDEFLRRSNHSDVDIVSVFCHHKPLRKLSKRFLEKGEKCRVLVELGPRGLFVKELE